MQQNFVKRFYSWEKKKLEWTSFYKGLRCKTWTYLFSDADWVDNKKIKLFVATPVHSEVLYITCNQFLNYKLSVTKKKYLLRYNL